MIKRMAYDSSCWLHESLSEIESFMSDSWPARRPPPKNQILSLMHRHSPQKIRDGMSGRRWRVQGLLMVVHCQLVDSLVLAVA